MAERFDGERLIIAATLDPVETGQEFETLPPHMTVVRWFQLPEESRRKRLDFAMQRSLIETEKPVFQNLTGGKLDQFGEHKDVTVRLINGAEIGPSFALIAFVSSLGRFRKDDKFAKTFTPHVTVTPERHVKRGEKLSLPTVALISAREGDPIQRVEAAYDLRSRRDG